MRCIDRGAWPLDELGEQRQFNRYQEAVPYLKQRLGRNCSFCERWIATSLAVEHKQAKSKASHLALTWSNFLLACSNCNSIKGAKAFDDADVLWPDIDDTFGAIEYLPSGRVRPVEIESADQRRRAGNLLGMVGMDRGPGEGTSDHRWFDRLEVWRLAQQSLEDITGSATPQMAGRIADTAASRGGFSILMRVFSRVPLVRDALTSRFPGTVLRQPETPRAL